MAELSQSSELLALTAEIVAAHVSNNSIAVGELPQLIRQIYGTLATSLIALVIAVPVSFGIALFLTELSPAWLKRPLGTAIELLAACQGLDFHRPLKTSLLLEKVYEKVRSMVSHYGKDRFFAPDIAIIKQKILNGEFAMDAFSRK